MNGNKSEPALYHTARHPVHGAVGRAIAYKFVYEQSPFEPLETQKGRVLERWHFACGESLTLLSRDLRASACSLSLIQGSKSTQDCAQLPPIGFRCDCPGGGPPKGIAPHPSRQSQRRGAHEPAFRGLRVRKAGSRGTYRFSPDHQARTQPLVPTVSVGMRSVRLRGTSVRISHPLPLVPTVSVGMRSAPLRGTSVRISIPSPSFPRSPWECVPFRSAGQACEYHILPLAPTVSVGMHTVPLAGGHAGSR